MRRRLYYGWYDQNKQMFLVSRFPADSPVRPSIAFESEKEVRSMLNRQRAEILWWPPLPRMSSAPLPIL